ncbi:hypothetical protein BDZ89DRAFT_1155039 [Hymenopellis radicata]|nr:hypothetical protein BDZ89DRAFT_1155039 [Hymenopellis radicata]
MSLSLPQNLLDAVVDHLSYDATSLRCLLATASCFQERCRAYLYRQFTIRVGRPSPSPVPAFLELVAPSGIHVESLIVNLRATGRLYDEEYHMLTDFAQSLASLQSLTLIFPANKYHCPNLNPVITLLPSYSATALCLQGARVEPRLLTRFLMGYPRVKSLRLRDVAFLEDDPDVRPGVACPPVEELVLSEPKSFFTARALPTHAFPFSLSGIRRLAIFNGPESPASWRDMGPLLNAVQRTVKSLYLSHYLTEINAAEPEIVSVLTMALRVPSVTIETLYMESTSLHFLYLFMTMLRDALVGGRVRVKELGIVVALHHTVSQPPKVETWHILAAVLEQCALQNLHITFTNGGADLAREAFHRLPLSEWEKDILDCFTSMRHKNLTVNSVYREDIYSIAR